MRIQILGCWFFGLCSLCAAAQSTATVADFPEIRITLSKSQYNSLLQSKGRKMELKNPVFLINMDSAKVKEVHSRGNNSLTFEHKSLSVDLQEALKVNIQGKVVKIKKFDLMNLVMDKHLWHNRWAFLGMGDASLFPLLNTFCTLWINGEPQGIYMLVEKPRHYTTTVVKSPYMLRRGIDHVVSDEYIDTPSKDAAKKYRQQYYDVYSEIGKFKGEELFRRLDKKIYMDHYFKWLAFNYLIMNGDYADELYLYILPQQERFDVIPWDYDDILKPVPHEGMAARNAVDGFKNKYIFSSEDPLDRAIAADEFVYEQYRKAFKELLITLTPDYLTTLTQRVRDELKIMSSSPAAPASLFLGKEAFEISKAEEDINLSLDFIIKRRNALLKELEK